MVKRYSEELAAWIEKRATKKRRQDAAAVAFLSVKADVIDAMEAGYAVTTIWEHMHETGRVKVSYETFRRHVQKYIKAGSPSAAPTPVAQPEPAKPAGKPDPKAKTGQAKKSEPPSVGGFTFNPTPDKKDLL